MTWPTLTLGQLTATTRPICYGVLKPGPYVEGGVPLLRIVDMAGDVVAQSGYHRISSALDSEFHRSRLRGGEVLLSIQGTVGRVATAPAALAGANISRTIAVIQPDSRLEPRFLRLYLMSRTAGSGFQTTGTTRASLNISVIREMPVPVPPLDEQRRIVDLLEYHLSRLDAAGGYLSSGLHRADVWYEQLLAETLWAADYPRVRVEDLLREPMRNGRSDRAAAGTEHGTRTLTLTAVTKNAFTEANTKMTVTPPERARGLWLEPGDVFVQRSNTPQLVGTTARYDGPCEWAIFPDLLIRLRANESKIDSRFLAAAMQSKPGHDQLRRTAKGLAGSMPKIDQNAIASTTIPIPSLDDQLRLLEAIRDAADARNLLRTELALAQRRSRRLRRALLEAAFSGRLTGAPSALSAAEEMIGA